MRLHDKFARYYEIPYGYLGRVDGFLTPFCSARRCLAPAAEATHHAACFDTLAPNGIFYCECEACSHLGTVYIDADIDTDGAMELTCSTCDAPDSDHHRFLAPNNRDYEPQFEGNR